MMEQKIVLLFIKISAFTLLPCIYHFYNSMNTLNKNLVEKWNLRRKFNSRTYRILANYKHHKYSSNAKLKEDMQFNEAKKEKNIYNNKEGTNEKHKLSCRGSLYIKQCGKNVKKSKCVKPKTSNCFDFEKKIFKKLDYEDYVKNIITIDYKKYKKLARKKRRVRIALLLLFILILILPLLDLSLENLVDGGLLGLLHLLSPTLGEKNALTGVDGQLVTLLSSGQWGYLEKICASTIFIYGVPFLIFVVIFIFGMVYYYKKVIKYENIKFKKRLNKR
ncbi:fam-l protein [Plasmodium brasilianum]|uniref:Fam-l protein n=1 Tax=Plasmodium brasilianum TaxID=5824 RepID=A0ACB9YD42_PLABR|nr:fam-l protein [Plasmodium brasilianum]